MKKGDYIINNLYQPGYSTFKPGEIEPSNYLGKANLLKASEMGMSLDPRTANQLGELGQKLNSGLMAAEIGTLSPRVFESMSEEQFKEIGRQAKLAGSKVTVHAPIQEMDPAGFDERGWNEFKQKIVEKRLMDVIDKTSSIGVGENVPITIHGSNFYGSTWKYSGEGKNRKKEYETLLAVNQETGEVAPIKNDKRYLPTPPFFDDYSPERFLEIKNHTQWDTETNKVLFDKEKADNILSRINPEKEKIYENIISKPEEMKNLSENEKEEIYSIHRQYQTAQAHLEDSELSLRSSFDKAYKFAGKNTEEIEKNRKELDLLAQKYSLGLKNATSFKDKSNVIQDFALELKKFRPEIYRPIESFATEKASETFSNSALYAYQKYKDKAPVISIENLDQGRFGFSQGEDMKKLVEESRKKFVEKATKTGISLSEAQKAAEKLIGVTIDVGHLNISKKYGYTDEDLVEEAKKMKPYVKHVHLTDNFGTEDSHLPIGMGNVPVQALIEALGEEGSKAIKINEVGGWFEFFKTNPYSEILAATGSPIYSSSNGPYWSQTTGFEQGYFGGYGEFLPQTNYSLFGAGFSQLPSHLGGGPSKSQSTR